MAAQPSTSKGLATRQRILEAAADEFAEHGIAGARVERVVQAARTNKAQLYGYFGSKDSLFDAVLMDQGAQVLNAIKFDAEDLAGCAVRLYDECVRRPDLIRLTTWARLERRPTGRLYAAAERRHDPKLDAIAEAQAAGFVRAGSPFDLLALVIGMAMAWSPVSTMYTATAADPDEEHERRRELLRECVMRAIAP